MERGYKVKIIYQKKDEIIERIVTPIVFKGEIVSCYDYFKKARRNYKLLCVLGVEILSEE